MKNIIYILHIFLLDLCIVWTIMEKKFRQGTLCVQAGYKAKNGEPIEVPIIQSTTFKYDGVFENMVDEKRVAEFMKVVRSIR